MPKNRFIQVLMFARPWDLGKLEYDDVYSNFVEMIEQLICEKVEERAIEQAEWEYENEIYLRNKG